MHHQNQIDIASPGAISRGIFLWKFAVTWSILHKKKAFFIKVLGNMRMDQNNVQRCIKASKGETKAELVFKNGTIVNVFTKELIQADVAVCDGLIVGIGQYEGQKEIDATGKYLCPGLVDSHVHIESSLVMPSEFVSAILPFGTTTIIADPHEIANVCGISGVEFMLEQTQNTPVNVLFMASSCVPGINSTALLRLKESDHRIIGLAEVMDYTEVLGGEPELLEKIGVFSGRAIDGHAPGLAGKELNAYALAGIQTDHECATIEETMERLRLGLYVQIREGTAAKNLTMIIRGLLEQKADLSRCLFCTDDKHIDEIKSNGHINGHIKKAIALGVDPIEAVCMATINAAQCYGLKKTGAIAPGYFADILVLSDLHSFTIESVYAKGRPAAKFTKPPLVLPKSVTDTIKIKKVKAGDLKIRIHGNTANIIEVIPGQILTRHGTAHVEAVNGVFAPDETYAKLAVVERHQRSGNIGLGIVTGFGIRNGAIGSSVAHDSHNIIVAGDNDADILLAVEALESAGGGLAVVSGGKVQDMLPLPVAGLMSDDNADRAAEKSAAVVRSALGLCACKEIEPFMTLAFLSLTVIPQIRLTEKGLYDVGNARFIDVSAD
jgi:adenine deaminase